MRERDYALSARLDLTLNSKWVRGGGGRGGEKSNRKSGASRGGLHRNSSLKHVVSWPSKYSPPKRIISPVGIDVTVKFARGDGGPSHIEMVTLEPPSRCRWTASIHRDRHTFRAR